MCGVFFYTTNNTDCCEAVQLLFYIFQSLFKIWFYILNTHTYRFHINISIYDTSKTVNHQYAIGMIRIIINSEHPHRAQHIIRCYMMKEIMGVFSPCLKPCHLYSQQFIGLACQTPFEMLITFYLCFCKLNSSVSRN